MKKFAIGDIHGEYDKLEKVLLDSNFNFENDLLITLGDIVDRGKDWVKCVDILLKIKNRIDIRGNHDQVFLHYIKTGVDMFDGNYGSKKTIKKYNNLVNKEIYIYFFNKQLPYYIDDENKLFVHAGFDNNLRIKYNLEDTLYWDRKLLEISLYKKIDTIENFKEVFIGHTPTITYTNKLKPTFTGNLIWNLDTSSGKSGLLTLMNIDTKEYFQY